MKFFSFLFFCAVLAACNSTPKPPADVMPQQKMQTVLWELMKADEVINHYAADPTKNRFAISVTMYNKVFAQQGITKQGFDKSMQWYSNHPQLLKAVLDSVQRKHKPKEQ